MPNTILVISPYREHGTWVFDDPNTGLVREPFVSGVPEMLDRLVRDIPDAERGFRLLFSVGPFPGYQAKFTRTRAEHSGTWYRFIDPNDNDAPAMEGWLCPALFKYFEIAPETLYARAEPLSR